MLDKAADDRWKAKLDQHRALRLRLYDKNRHPKGVFAEVVQYNGGLLHEWMEFNEAAWLRVPPRDPSVAANSARKEIEDVIVAEQKAISLESKDVWPAGQASDVQQGLEELSRSCGTLKTKCFESIANLEAARGRDILAAAEEKKERRRELFLGNALSLIVGGAVAIFSVWITNNSNKSNLEPYVKTSIGDQDKMGQIAIKDDTINLVVTNAGYSDVEEVEVFVDTFHGSFNLENIAQDAYQPAPLISLGKLEKGEAKRFEFGKQGTPLVWENIFKNEINVYRKDKRYAGMLLFMRIQVRCRRESDKKLFQATRVFYAQRNGVIPWNVALGRDEFLAGRLN